MQQQHCTNAARQIEQHRLSPISQSKLCEKITQMQSFISQNPEHTLTHRLMFFISELGCFATIRCPYTCGPMHMLPVVLGKTLLFGLCVCLQQFPGHGWFDSRGNGSSTACACGKFKANSGHKGRNVRGISFSPHHIFFTVCPMLTSICDYHTAS
jgi:hypothetical protein